MIRVTIEMVPGGIERFKRHMATIEIHNDVDQTLSTAGKRGGYVAKLSRISQHGEHLGWYDRTVHILDINRNRSGAVYRILYQSLKEFLRES